MSSLSDRMRLAADIIDEAQAKYLDDYPWLTDELAAGWSAGGLRTFADQWERATDVSRSA